MNRDFQFRSTFMSFLYDSQALKIMYYRANKEWPTNQMVESVFVKLRETPTHGLLYEIQQFIQKEST